MSEAVVEVSGLTRRFGATTALTEVDLALGRGVVHGLVGANGAGKTTLIRHVLGLLRAQRGNVRVFGLDPVAEPQAVLGRVGYLSEENDLPGWMRVDELLRYSRAFYSDWDDDWAAQLGDRFGLERSARLRELSKGQRARAGLLVALAHRPELLVLDEPSSGLDPIVRRDILGAVLRTVADEGRTVLFSSHLLDEVEQVADQVTMIDRGQILLQAPLAEIRRAHRHLTLRFPDTTPEPDLGGPLLALEHRGEVWTGVARADLAAVRAAVGVRGGSIVADRAPSLDEVFVAYAGRTPATSGDD